MKWKNQAGVTLVEVLVAISIFAVVAVIAVNIMINVAKIEKRSAIETAIYEDLRFTMQRLSNEIQNGAIDYEEYYSVYVAQNNAATSFYGINYGVYGSRFYDPGKSLDKTKAKTSNPSDLGQECSFEKDGECEVVYTLSTDINVGQNPFFGDATVSNAFCDKAKGLCAAPGVVDELYLIDKTGTKKTIIGLKKTTDTVNDDHALAMVEMEGLDLDQNGIVDTFRCLPQYHCYDEAGVIAGKIMLPFQQLLGKATSTVVTEQKITLPRREDLSENFAVSDVAGSEFVPLSPLRSSIKGLKFIITPLEDPYKAFAEKGARMQPSVTIILKIGLSEQALKDYPGEFEDITVQTTVKAGVLNRIDSYPPVNDVKVGVTDTVSVAGWITNVLGGSFETP